MKIIGKDNYDNETVSEILICLNISEYYGKIIVDFLNNLPQEQWFYALMKDDYQLYEWEP